MQKIDFAAILSATHTAVIHNADTTAVAKACFTLHAKHGSTIEEILAMDRAAQGMRKACDGMDTGHAASLRTILQSEGVDVTKRSAVSAALAAEVWLDSAKDNDAQKLARTEPGAIIKPDSKKGLSEAALTYYNKIAQRIGRLAKGVVGKDADAPAAQRIKAKTPVARDLQKAINALVAEGYERKAMLTAVARAYAA
jgi:hypothetical protein